MIYIKLYDSICIAYVELIVLCPSLSISSARSSCCSLGVWNSSPRFLLLRKRVFMTSTLGMMMLSRMRILSGIASSANERNVICFLFALRAAWLSSFESSRSDCQSKISSIVPLSESLPSRPTDSIRASISAALLLEVLVFWDMCCKTLGSTRWRLQASLLYLSEQWQSMFQTNIILYFNYIIYIYSDSDSYYSYVPYHLNHDIIHSKHSMIMILYAWLDWLLQIQFTVCRACSLLYVCMSICD